MPRPHRDMPDDDLMKAYVQGDAAAFDALYARHEGALFRFVARVLGAAFSAQVDEVFQETWLRIIAARETFAPQGAAWRTWAFTIAHNAAVDRLRTGGREVPLHGDDEGDPLDWLEGALDASHPSSEDEAFWRAAGRQLLLCLDELPAPQAPRSCCTTKTARAWKTWRARWACRSRPPRAGCAMRCRSCAAA
jgi:RNA polymerase sigma factor (sigma-70 family)